MPTLLFPTLQIQPTHALSANISTWVISFSAAAATKCRSASPTWHCPQRAARSGTPPARSAFAPSLPPTTAARSVRSSSTTSPASPHLTSSGASCRSSIVSASAPSSLSTASRYVLDYLARFVCLDW
jgi:hypothetical protein